MLWCVPSDVQHGLLYTATVHLTLTLLSEGCSSLILSNFSLWFHCQKLRWLSYTFWSSVIFLLKYTSGCLCTAQNVCLSLCLFQTSFARVRESVKQNRNRRHAKSRNRVLSAPCVESSAAHYSITLSLQSMYILVHTRTNIPGYLIPVRDLLPRKNKKYLGCKRKDEIDIASACSTYRGTATTDLTSYFYDTHNIHHGRKGEGNMKEEQQLSVIVIKWRQRPAWALYTPT